MTTGRYALTSALALTFCISLTFLQACGGGGGNGGGGGGNPPGTPTGLTATAGNAQVALTWNASSGATSYNVGRSATSGGPYTAVSSPANTSYTDATVTNGTTYYYVVSASNSYGTSANSTQVSATPSAPIPPAPTNLTATAGVQEVVLTWTASTGATSYNVKRGTASGGPFTTVASPVNTNYTDTGLMAATTYYYVVTAVNGAGESGNSNQVSAIPLGQTTSVSVDINVLANRHTISPYIYGGSFPNCPQEISDSGLTIVRWGGNASSTYNWQLGTDNADNDYYFEDFGWSSWGIGANSGPFTCSQESNSANWIHDVQAAGGYPLTTMAMLPWVAQSPEQSIQQGNGSNNYHWVFSVSQDGACSSKVDPYNMDAGINLESDCSTTMVASTTQLNRVYYPLLDDHTQACNSPSSTCEYRSDWATALAGAFSNPAVGAPPCVPIPYSTITSCHFYNMDNEIDIWGGTHVDVHPNPASYDELANVFLTESGKLKGWDPQAVRLGPVSCCWYFYWRSEVGGSDTTNHGGVDFLPWWLNQVYWNDQISGKRSLDIFDIHAYPDADTSGLTAAQKQALAVKIYRDWWDPSFPSAAQYIVNDGFTNNETIPSNPFRIPRMRALVNMIYPGTPMSVTEWSAEFAGSSDFSTALGDADAYGVMGRERLSLASRWTAPNPSNPNYQSLKLYTNYDGAHHGFESISVSDTNNGNPDLFSSYAALNSAGNTMTLIVLNKDPQNSAQVSFAFNGGFSAGTFVSFTLAASAPTTIAASASQSWNSTQTFAPYSATLLVISGSMANVPASEWDLNPDTIMVPAGGTVTLQPKIIGGSANVTLSSPVFDSFEGAPACSGSLTLTTATITPTQPGKITVNAGGMPAFCHFTVTGSDGTVAQTQGGWIVVGNPPASLTPKSGNGQTGTHGTQLANPLVVTLSPGNSGGTATGASIFLSVDPTSAANGATLTYNTSTGPVTGPRVLAATDASGNVSVTLTLPSTAGTVTVTAEGPYALGHPIATFTETSQ
jgi:hypothetical protein